MATTATMNPLKKIVIASIVGALIGLIGSVVGRRTHAPPELVAQLKVPVVVKISLALWFVFSIYWSIASKDSAPTKTSESKWSRQWHLILVNVALLLLVVPVPGLTRRFLPQSHVLEALGLAIQAGFILLAAWGRRHLGSNWSGEVRIAAGHQLVRSGPYRLVRHPIYTGVLGMYCGTALVSGQIHAPLALVLVTLAYWRKIRLEERALAETFGGEFEDYRRGTWALVPLVY